MAQLLPEIFPNMELAEVLGKSHEVVLGLNAVNGYSYYLFNSTDHNLLAAFHSSHGAAVGLFPGISLQEANVSLDALFRGLGSGPDISVIREYYLVNLEYIHTGVEDFPRRMYLVKLPNVTPVRDIPFWYGNLFSLYPNPNFIRVGFGIIALVIVYIVGTITNDIPA